LSELKPYFATPILTSVSARRPSSVNCEGTSQASHHRSPNVPATFVLDSIVCWRSSLGMEAWIKQVPPQVILCPPTRRGFVDRCAIGALSMAPMPLYSRTLPPGFIAPCLPSNAAAPPSGKLWLHEVKHDGFRVIARKAGERVRLYSRPGNDLTYRFPLHRRGSGQAALALLHHRRGGRGMW
jgi:hypothetical protein